MSSAVRRRLTWGFDPVQLDCLVAVLLLVALQVQIWAGGHDHGRVGLAVIAVALTVAVAIRRRWMLEALLLACVAFVVKLGFFSDRSGQGGALAMVALLLLFYGAGAFLDERRAWFALAISATLGMAIGLSKSGVIGALFGVVAFVLLPWIVGRARRLARNSKQRIGTCFGAQANWKRSCRRFHQGISIGGRSALRMIGL